MKSFCYHPKVKRIKKGHKVHVCCLGRYMAILCIYILHKNNSKSNIMKENYHSSKLLNYLLVGFAKFLDGIISSISKVNIFMERVCQLKNFEMNFKGCHLVYQFRNHTRKLIAN